jgi:hypothetical protein
LDVIFAIDESTSMKSAQEGVRTQVRNMFTQLVAAASTAEAVSTSMSTLSMSASSSSSFRVGLVGFGQQADLGNPVLRHALTRNQTSFEEAVDALASHGGREPGFMVAQQVAANRVGGSPMNSDPLYPGTFPGLWGYCLVLVSDEDSDGVETLADTVNALIGTGGFFFAITNGQQEYIDLAEATGGMAHDLQGFVADSGPVLEKVLSTCASRVVEPWRRRTPTYHLWNSTSDEEVAEMHDGWTGCITEPFNLEVRLCELPAATTPVRLKLRCDGGVRLVYRSKEHNQPWFLFGNRDADILPNRESLGNRASCRISATIDGLTTYIRFTQQCR